MFWLIGIVLAVLGFIALLSGNPVWGVILILVGFVLAGGTYSRRVP